LASCRRTQAKLLRILQHGEFERLGSPRTLRVDVRVIAATNGNLADEVKSGRFRRDLSYRLNVFPITMPPLRQRQSDIPALTQHMVKRLVCELVAHGLLNKQIAYELGTSEKTIKVHRARVMHKLEVDSVAALVWLLARLPKPPAG
jgi:transcriptional regulator with GAF, ATPase, and Fis domain